MKTVKMVAKIGDQCVSVGNCNSAQARILVRDDLAAWQDGQLMLFIRKAHLALNTAPTLLCFQSQLMLFIRKAHLAVLDANPHAWRCKEDDHNVSEAEMDRRRTWFISLTPLVVEMTTNKRGSERALIHEQAIIMMSGSTLRHDEHESTVTRPETEVSQQHRIVGMLNQMARAEKAIQDGSEDELLDEPDTEDELLDEPDTEDDIVYNGDEIGDLSNLWHTEPNVDEFFGINRINRTLSPDSAVVSLVKNESGLEELKIGKLCDVELLDENGNKCDDPHVFSNPHVFSKEETEEMYADVVTIPSEFVLTKRAPYVLAINAVAQ